MGSEHRVKRLRELIEQLERLPATAERDQMLREVRARVVDVDTGVAPDGPALDPGALPGRLRRAPAPPPPAVTRAVRPEPPVAPRLAPAKPAPPPQPRADEPEGPDGVLSLAADDVLLLDDPPYLPGDEQGEARVAPWTRGLRG